MNRQLILKRVQLFRDHRGHNITTIILLYQLKCPIPYKKLDTPNGADYRAILFTCLDDRWR